MLLAWVMICILHLYEHSFELFLCMSIIHVHYRKLWKYSHKTVGKCKFSILTLNYHCTMMYVCVNICVYSTEFANVPSLI